MSSVRLQNSDMFNLGCFTQEGGVITGRCVIITAVFTYRSQLVFQPHHSPTSTECKTQLQRVKQSQQSQRYSHLKIIRIAFQRQQAVRSACSLSCKTRSYERVVLLKMSHKEHLRATWDHDGHCFMIRAPQCAFCPFLNTTDGGFCLNTGSRCGRNYDLCWD